LPFYNTSWQRGCFKIYNMSNWISKTEDFLQESGFTCPQGNTNGGLEPVAYKEKKERPGDVVKCRCKHCGCIATIEWRFIQNYLQDE